MVIKKKITTFNLDEALIKEFDNFCAAEDKSRSKVVNRILTNFVQAKRNAKKR